MNAKAPVPPPTDQVKPAPPPPPPPQRGGTPPTLRAWELACPQPRIDELEFFTVYRHPSDYPDRWVVRRSWMVCGPRAVSGADAEPLAVCHDLAECRDAIQAARPGLHLMRRHPDEDPVIFEVWL